MRITGGQVFDLEQGFVSRDVCFDGEKLEQSSADGKTYDASGCYVIPGLTDLHFHGCVGEDFSDATPDGLQKMADYELSRGVTQICPAGMTLGEDQLTRICQNAAAHRAKNPAGAELVGLHLEGPFLAAEYKGAMPEHLLQKKNIPLIEEYQQSAGGAIRYITVSPEVEGMVEDIPRLKALGIQVAIGHSGADYETAMAAIRQGAAASTHTGNAMKLLHQHFPAIWGAVLEDDRVYCEMICDGRHLHPGTVRLILKTKGLDRTVAVTDSIMAAGLPDGSYKLGVNDVVVKDGDAKLASDGTRAGSTLTTGKAFENLIAFTGKGPEEVLRLLTENPARLLGMEKERGFIQEGLAADFVVLDDNNRVMATYVGGREVFSSEQWKYGN